MERQTLENELKAIQEDALQNLSTVTSKKELDDWRVTYLGKKSPVSLMMRQLGSFSAEERPAVGQIINGVRSALEAHYQEKRTEIEEIELAARFERERVDVTLPGRRPGRGALHPITRTVQEIEDIFLGMGFEIVDGPEVETDAYNFEKLNLPKDHPARDMQDTFYLTEELLLRTHTSPMQVRTMERVHPNVPVKVLVPGRVYRRDEDDATHSHAFNQIEGLVVDRNIRMSDLKGVLEQFAKAIFGPDQAVRLRPSFFPFTEPSTEVDVRCIQCGGAGCRVCKHTGWIEVLGAGMVHPRVLDGAGYDSTIYSGFAFGMGPERIAMLKYGIQDIRALYQNDLRFLRQFRQSL